MPFMGHLWFSRSSKSSLASRLVTVDSLCECSLPCSICFSLKQREMNSTGALKLLGILELCSTLHGFADHWIREIRKAVNDRENMELGQFGVIEVSEKEDSHFVLDSDGNMLSPEKIT